MMDIASQGPFQNLLVGVDFSNFSKLVVKQAEELAKEFKAKMIFIHAVPELGFELSPPQYSNHDFSEVNKDEIQKSIENFYQVKADENLQILIEEGYPQDVILKIAAQFPERLIIIGSEGRNSISRLILGSHAERIAMLSPYPVWIHRGDKVVGFHNILVPTDLSEKSRQMILRLKNWTRNFGISFQYLFVRPEILPLLDSKAYREMTDDIRESARRRIEKFKSRGLDVPISMIAGEDPSRQISKVGERFDVIAMNPHNHSDLFHPFGRITSKVLRLAHTPILVMRT